MDYHSLRLKMLAKLGDADAIYELRRLHKRQGKDLRVLSHCNFEVIIPRSPRLAYSADHSATRHYLNADLNGDGQGEGDNESISYCRGVENRPFGTGIGWYHGESHGNSYQSQLFQYFTLMQKL